MGNILGKPQSLAPNMLGWNPDSRAGVMRSELCVKGLRQRAQTWRVKGGSWTAEITTSTGSASHYITCPGHHEGSSCVGRWSRRLCQTAVPGLHCVFGGWAMFDGNTVVGVQPSTDGDRVAIGQEHMRLRQLWADHILAQVKQRDADTATDQGETPSMASVAEVHAMLEKAVAESAQARAGEGRSTGGEGKKLGRGSGGPSGVTENGTVLKRDTRDREAALRADRCDLDLGRVWERGDVDACMPFFGWSALISRDGRWRPGYHLNMLFANWTTVIDYGLTRPVYRERQLSWMRVTELVWADPPLDMTGEYVQLVRQDAATMTRRELERSRALEAKEYKPDDFATAGKRHVAMQDQAGQAIAYHALEEGLETPRGLVATTAMVALNDIQDYERDVFGGETNNLARGLTSDQQVVDTAAWILEAMVWAMDNKDYDLSDVLLGSVAIFMVMWRYNTPKMARYEALSIRSSLPGTPPELDDVAEIVRSGVRGAASGPVTYGELYRRAERQARKLYGGCCCVTPPEGHDAWRLLAQAMDEKGNDDAEHRLLVACVALNNGAQSGDVRCDCGLDLLLYESFARFLNPDTGIVARVHYRTDITKLGNTVTE